MRGFEFARKVVTDSEGNKSFTEEKAYENAKYPVQATNKSAGVDFFCAEDVTIPSIWKLVFNNIGTRTERAVDKICDSMFELFGYTKEDPQEVKVTEVAPTLVHTGIKVKMEDDEVFELYDRSSNPKKLGLVLANSVGVVDADYYGCKDNDGEIMFSFYNFKLTDTRLKAGDKIGQGVFKKFLKAEFGVDKSDDGVRVGGFGSTDTEPKSEDAEAGKTDETV